jgi:hypothetical protein
MCTGKRSYWRAFGITAAVVGAINVAIFLYYLSLPIVPLRGQAVGRDLPNNWLTVAMLIINLPGGLAVRIFSPLLDSTTPLGMALPQAISTGFWGLIAIFIERIASDFRNQDPAAKRPAPNPDGASEAD